MTILDEIEAAIPVLRRHARGLMRGAEAADDLVQDCLERAVARRAGYRGEGSVRAWLFGILANCHRDMIRRRRDGGHLVDAVDLGGEPAPALAAHLAQPPTQEAHLALAEVGRALARLPVDQRQALLLVAVEGFSVAETALVLAVPEGTVMSRVARARASLRDMTGRPRPTRRKEGNE